MNQRHNSQGNRWKTGSEVKGLVAVIALTIVVHTVRAGSATWNLNPLNNHWSQAQNWTPAGAPNGEDDVATFGTSNITGVMLGVTQNGDAGNTLGGIVFGPGASAYTITMTAVLGQTSYLAFYGTGITNNSGITQNFIAAKSAISDSARIYFENSSSAGESVVITNQASVGVSYGAFTSFDEFSTAGSATIINEGAAVSGTIWGGFTDLLYYSNAEAATFINNPGVVSGAAAGHTLVQIYAPGTIGSSTFINNAAKVPGAESGWTEIDGTISDGASFIANGATVADAQGGQVYTYGGDGYATYAAEGGSGDSAQGGLIDLWYVPASTQTVVAANGGTNGGLGGTVLIEGSADIIVLQFQVFGNGTLDLTNVSDNSMPIGSLAGDGIVLLAGHELGVGNNNLNTTFSGVIQESGSLRKTGAGALILSGANSYTDGTKIEQGVLLANSPSGSSTGSGKVKVDAGTLGGNGIIAGAVTVGTGSGTGAFLAPSQGVSRVVTLTIQSKLIFKADATCTCRLDTRRATSDQVVANGVTISNGAQFDFQTVANKKLSAGRVFTAISNTSANPISGTFANLPDGSTFTSGRNKFQVSYEGGTGNNLTLTVVP